MARYNASFSQVTAGVVADSTPFTIGQSYGSLRANTTLLLKINEVYIGGESTASTPTTVVLARCSTLSVGALSYAGSGGGIALADALSTAPGTTPNWGNVAVTSYPSRSAAATGYLLDLSLNTFGGIARWQARYGEEITVYSGTQPLGEVVLSSKAGAGVASGHVLLEAV